MPLTAQAAISPREAARSATGLPFAIEIEDQIPEAVPVRPEVVEVEATVVEPGEIAAALTEESPTDLPPDLDGGLAPLAPSDEGTAETAPEESETAPEPDPDVDLLGLLTTVVELPEAPYAVGEGLTAGEVNVVGVTWQDEGRDEEVAVYLRTGTNGGWGAWESYEVEPSHEPGARSGTDPIVLLGAGIDVQVAASYGDAAPTDVTLSVVDPLRAPADSAADLDVTGTAGGLARPMSASVTSSPVIYSRNDWGADPALLDWTPEHGRVGGVVVHHTAGTNGYSASQVPAILRGIYYYHSVTRAWGDIGYNLLADSYGRLWEGRAGGLSQPIIGAHATGWNSNTFGISVLGDFTQTALPEAAMNALSHAIAWKFLLHGVNPDGTMAVNGATRATIVGHRDVGNTVCPGDRIYSRIGELRSNVKSIIASGIYTSSSTPTPTPSPSPSVPQDVVGATPAPVAAPFPVNPTAASGLQGYDPNRLMSDSVMYNPSTMNTASVQSFLDTRGSSCVQGSDGSSCLKNATFSTPNRAATAYCSQPYQGQANESVAAIIAKS
nr:hypothetical protein [Actinomycetales bacterium]